ncbi:MAG: hypothetical protein P8X70_02975, partial [Nanoarchaeota archaeon]
PIFLIYIFGALCRMAVVFWWIPKFKEARNTEKPKSSKAIRNILFKQAKSSFVEEAHEIMSIKNYLRMK